MVRLADWVTVEKGAENWQSWHNKIDRKHVDFVVCQSDTTEPILAIELDDKSHARAGRAARDAEKDDYLAAAGLPLLRIPAARGYSVADLEAAIASRLNASTGS